MNINENVYILIQHVLQNDYKYSDVYIKLRMTTIKGFGGFRALNTAFKHIALTVRCTTFTLLNISMTSYQYIYHYFMDCLMREES